MMYRFLLSACFASFALFSTSVIAQDNVTNISAEEVPTYNFTKKRYSIQGTAKILQTGAGTELVFDDSFKTKGGPDLKVYLSKKTLAELDNSTVIDNSLKIGVLRSKSGAQSYVIPSDVNLSDYKSVLIHCEAFTVLWGGFDL